MKEKILDFVYQNWKLIVIAAICIFLLVIGWILLFSEEQESVSLEPIVEVKEDIGQPIKTMYKVDIKGAVVNPGVYEMIPESRVADVIEKSGGLTKEADTSVLNLSKVIRDEMVIIIYTAKELESMRKGNTTIKYIEKECICPKLENDACIEDKITNEENNDISDSKPSGKISLNNASLKELTNLTGIGEKKAQAIIEYRNQNGGFKSIEEITKVSGIGKSTYEKIKDQLTL